MEILFYFIFISSWSSEDLVDAWNSSARGGMPKSVHACTAFFSLRASCMKIFCYRAWGSAMDRAQRILLYMHRAQACPFFTCVNYVHRAWRFFVNVHRARTPHASPPQLIFWIRLMWQQTYISTKMKVGCDIFHQNLQIHVYFWRKIDRAIELSIWNWKWGYTVLVSK